MKTETGLIHRFRWGMSDEAQVWIAHCGSKSTPLIAQLARQIGLESRVLPLEELGAAYAIARSKPKLIILSGGAQSVYDEDALTISRESLEFMNKRTAFLGICYGAQLLAQICGGEVRRATKGEYSIVNVEVGVYGEHDTYFGSYLGGPAVMNHGDEIVSLPEGWKILGSSADCRAALIGAGTVWGAQFHPEMDHTVGGDELLKHVAFAIAGCKPDYRFNHDVFVEKAVAWMRDRIPEGNVLLGLSGGVDSSVAYEIARRAYGSRLHALYIDTGFNRENETEEVRAVFGEDNISYVDARMRFYEMIEAIAYPKDGSDTGREHAYYDRVRRVMGETFIETFLEEAARRDLRPIALCQGTNIADIIESETGLKRHHNVGGLPDRLGVEIVEVLAGLYKFEIRALAIHLGLPEEIAYRQPFPGPGLSIRGWGKIDRDLIPPTQRANKILDEVVRKHYRSWSEKPCQYYVAIARLPTTGLMGDQRVVGYIAMVRMVWSRERESYASLEVKALNQRVQDELSQRLTSEVRMENGTRIVAAAYILSGKPPATTEPH